MAMFLFNAIHLEQGMKTYSKSTAFFSAEVWNDSPIVLPAHMYRDDGPPTQMSEINTFHYTDKDSGAYVDVKFSGNGTMLAAIIDEDSNEVGDLPGYICISFYLRLNFTGKMNWANVTFSFADIVINESLNYSGATIFSSDGFNWSEVNYKGIDMGNGIVWANVTHSNIFAAFAQPEEDGGGVSDGGEGKAKEASDSTSMGLVILGMVFLLIFVILGVFLYLRGRKRREEDEEDGDKEDEDKEDEDKEDKEKIEETNEVKKEVLEKDDDSDEKDKVAVVDLEIDNKVKPADKMGIPVKDIRDDDKAEEKDVEVKKAEVKGSDITPNGKTLADSAEPDIIEEEAPIGDGETDETKGEGSESPNSMDSLDDIEIVGETPSDAPAPVMRESVDDLDDIVVAGETTDDAPAPSDTPDPVDDLDDIVIAGETPVEAPLVPGPREPVEDLDDIVIGGESPDDTPAPIPQVTADDLNDIEKSGKTLDEDPAPPSPQEPADDLNDTEMYPEVLDDSELSDPEEDVGNFDSGEEAAEVLDDSADPVSEEETDVDDIMALFGETDDADEEEYDELDDIEIV